MNNSFKQLVLLSGKNNWLEILEKINANCIDIYALRFLDL